MKLRKSIGKILIFILMFIICQEIKAQNNRLNNYNHIGWYNYFGDFKLSSKFNLHTDYQWFRDNYITDWQSGTLSVCLDYLINPRVFVRLGTSWIESFPYGEIPINGLGRETDEIRFFEIIQLSHKENIVNFSHRFTFEQRYLGRYSSAKATYQDDYVYQNRVRYLFKLTVPFKGLDIKPKVFYFNGFNEIFIGFGEQVLANVFNENRTGLLIGYVFNKHFSLEAGYINQILELGRLIDSRNVFQYNSGLMLNALVKLDLSKKNK